MHTSIIDKENNNIMSLA